MCSPGHSAGSPGSAVVRGVYNSLTAAHSWPSLATLTTLTGACGSAIFFTICKICQVLLTSVAALLAVSILISRAV